MVPQRPLVTATPITLLAYATYPHTPEATADTQAVVTTLLKQLDIQYLIEREGLHSCKLWSDVLSLGELQSLACVRMLYQLLGKAALCAGAGNTTMGCCRWAILDDCTSAMDAAAETRFFQYAASHGISVLSFSQREAAAAEDEKQQKERATRLLTLGSGVNGWELK